MSHVKVRLTDFMAYSEAEIWRSHRQADHDNSQVYHRGPAQYHFTLSNTGRKAQGSSGASFVVNCTEGQLRLNHPSLYRVCTISFGLKPHDLIVPNSVGCSR